MAAIGGGAASYSDGDSVLDSGEVLVGGFDLDDPGGAGSEPGLEFDDSSEMLVGPFSHAGSAVSAWSAASRESGLAVSASVAVVDSRTAGATSPAGVPARMAQLGRFRLVGVVGEGQHATVYRAIDPVLERDVALKVPRQGVLRTARALERFLGEARAMARLRHPRIVPVYEAGCAGERHFIAMALIEGRTLADRLAEGPLTLHRATEIVAELAEALAYAHSQGVVHRDVKPANVRLDGHGAVYLMDFGLAYRPDSDEVPVPPGAILGTPAYVAPEQAQGGQSDVLPASDQYSLGAAFYELLCGRPPFCGPPSYVLFQVIHQDPLSPRVLAPKVPRPLAAICLKALAKRPEQRYTHCQDFADDLRRWLHGETPLACRGGWSWLGR
jgi:serine/threonine protein kinase